MTSHRIHVLALALSIPLVASAQPAETLDAILARKIERTKASVLYREIHTPHLKTFAPRPWAPDAGEFAIDATWSLRSEGPLDEPGPFAREELRTFFRDAGGIELNGTSAGREIVLRVAGAPEGPGGADAYRIAAAPKRVEIVAPTWRGVLFGVYHLEDRLLERGAPLLRPFDVSRRPDYDVRMFGEPMGTFTISGLRIDRPISKETFSAAGRFGANATFTFVRLGDYIGPGRFPELANPRRAENVAALRRQADLARSAGVGLYLDAYNLKLPSNHPAFAARPESRGARQFGGDIRCLCPSDPWTREFIAESWADVFREVPSIAGMVAIIGGEGFYHCYMRSDKGGPDCPRCAKRKPEEVVADLTNAVFRAIRRVRPDAELMAWPYSAFVWSADPFQLDLIARLDPGIRIVPEIDKDFLYRKDGYAKNIWDYSIDFIGPSDRCLAMTKAARERGLKVHNKTETAVSLEFNGVPSIPCLPRWAARMDAVASTRPDSIYYSYDVTGFTRSRSEELAGRLSWSPRRTADEEVRALAARDFGAAAAPGVVEAWRLFGDAIGHCPHLTHGYYMGPSFIGPGQPLMLEELRDEMPAALFGRLFYLAEGDVSEGTSEASMVRPVFASEIKTSEAERADMRRAVASWEQGLRSLRAAEALVPGYRMGEYRRERDLAEYFLTMLKAIADGNEFFALRAEWKDLRAGAASPERAARERDLLGRMETVVRRDLENARASLPFIRRQPGLDFSVRLDLDYRPLAEIVEAKIAYTEDVVLKRQFSAAR